MRLNSCPRIRNWLWGRCCRSQFVSRKRIWTIKNAQISFFWTTTIVIWTFRFWWRSLLSFWMRNFVATCTDSAIKIIGKKYYLTSYCPYIVPQPGISRVTRYPIRRKFRKPDPPSFSTWPIPVPNESDSEKRPTPLLNNIF